MVRPKKLGETSTRTVILEIEQINYLEVRVGRKGSVSEYVRALINKDMESAKMSKQEQEA